MVLDTAKPKNRKSTILPGMRGRDAARKLTLKVDILQVCTIDFSETKSIYRESQLLIGWTEQKCIEMDKLAQQNHSYRLSREEFKRYQGQWYLTLSESGKNARMSRRRTCRTHSFSTISKMAPFFLK